MGLKRYKPTTPSERFHQSVDFAEVTRNTPEKRLTKGFMDKAGRGAGGRISVRRRGGGHKKKYRQIDFKRNKFNVPGKVAHIEYDPNRTAYIALIHYVDGDKRYILCPKELEVGMTILSSDSAPISVGNSLPLKNIPVGKIVHNIELKAGFGGQLARSAGAKAMIASRDNSYVLLKLPSGETRKIHEDCRATIGSLSNEDHMNISLGKAGRSRWLGKRPKVRGVVMNPVDHPHGGGEGRTSGGRHPVTPWGKGTKGLKTRKKNKSTNRFIVNRRK